MTENRFKAAIFATVDAICKEYEAKNLESSYSESFKAALVEATCKIAVQSFTDLEAFSKHAKRKEVNELDVRLLVRRNPSLLKIIDQICSDLKETKVASRKIKDNKT